MNMNTGTRKASKAQKKTVAVVAIALALLGIALFAFSCATSSPAEEAQAADVQTASRLENQAHESAESGNENDQVSADDAAGVAGDNAASEDGAEAVSTASESPGDGNASSNHSAPQATGHQSISSSPTPERSKQWVEDTDQVWVVDREAWSEQVPIYSTTEVSICNICNIDITGNTAAHGKAHMKAGEGSGHHSEVRRTITGYNTVSHPEEGHWETKVVGGHWE